MGKPNALSRRNGIWRYRRRWPSDVVAGLKGDAFARSLRTGDYQCALKLLPDIEAEYWLIVRRARAGDTGSEVSPTTQSGIYRRTVYATWPTDATLPELPAGIAEVLAKRFFSEAMRSLNAEPPASELTSEAVQIYREEIEDRLALFHGQDASDERDHLIGTEIAVLRGAGFRVDPASEARSLLRNFLQRALVQVGSQPAEQYWYRKGLPQTVFYK